jgi:hypothetical protein
MLKVKRGKLRAGTPGEAPSRPRALAGERSAHTPRTAPVPHPQAWNAKRSRASERCT